MFIGCAYELAGPNIFQLTPHQQLVGGALSFVLHLCGTDLPIMVFIYAILLPRYARLFSPPVSFLVGAVSYPLMHVFSRGHAMTRSITLLSPSSSLCSRSFPQALLSRSSPSGPATRWVHMWAFHAITPHVMVDTRLVVRDFNIR